MGAFKRLVLVLCVAGAGSALFASPAFAGQVDHSTGLLTAAISNLTPYPMTLVAAQTPGTTPQNPQPQDYWSTPPAAAIPAGGASSYALNTNYDPGTGLFCAGDYLFGFDAYMTYRVDVVGGPAEYVTLAISQAESHTVLDADCGPFPAGDHDPRFDVYDTTTPPPPGYDPSMSPGTPPSPTTQNAQISDSHNVPTAFDQTFQIVGNFTIDASTNLGAPFVNVLNTLCIGAVNTTCSFTQAGPLTWGTGDPGSPFAATHCGSAGGQNNTFTVAYTATQSTSLTVGGGITVGAEFTLFDVIGNSISVSVQASHQWTETTSITRQSSIDIPPNDIAFLWVVPVVGTVTGTLVVSDGPATFTATNFSETRSGVTKDALTPAYDVITKVRPMTAGELQSHCPPSLSSTRPGVKPGRPSINLVPGHGVARVSLGQTQAQVARELGPPMGKHFLVNPCQGLDARCDAVAGTGGRWSYRQLSVVFGPDLRVSGLIYRGARRSAKGVGVGSSLPVLLGGYRAASCSSQARRMNCTLTAVNAGRTVKTVFSFKKTSGGLFKCDRVLIYVIDPGSEQMSS